MELIEPDRWKMNSVCSALLSAHFPNLVPLTRDTYNANTSPGASLIMETTLLGAEDRERDNKLHLFDTVLRSQWEHFESVQSKAGVPVPSRAFFFP